MGKHSRASEADQMISMVRKREDGAKFCMRQNEDGSRTFTVEVEAPGLQFFCDNMTSEDGSNLLAYFDKELEQYYTPPGWNY